MPEPNEELFISMGTYASTARIGHDEYATQLEVEWSTSDFSELVVSADLPSNMVFRSILGGKSFEVRIANSTDWIGCVPIGSADGPSLRLKLLRSPIQPNQNTSDIRSLDFGIVNFRLQGFIPVFSVQSGGWQLDLRQNDGSKACWPTMKNESESGFSHVGTLRHVDGSSYNSEQALEILWRLNLFASFCCERWIATGNAEGVNEQGQVVMRLFGVGKFAVTSTQSNWLDSFHIEGVPELFAKFLDLTAEDDWSDCCRTCIYWYLRADTEAAGPDGALILLQAALERLSWQLLVISKKMISPDGFGKVNFADQLRLMLASLDIPLAIPASLAGLTTRTPGHNWIDGPEALVETRNSLVHSARRKQSKKFYYFEAFTLAKWYFELSMLSMLKYRGLYSNRTIISRWRGQVEKVPWIAS